jgi:hypothetical protein
MSVSGTFATRLQIPMISACAGRSQRDPAGEGPARVRPSEPPGSECCPGITLVDIDPWGAFEKLWEHPEEGEPADERRGEQVTGKRMPAKKPRPRRSARSS